MLGAMCASDVIHRAAHSGGVMSTAWPPCPIPKRLSASPLQRMRKQFQPAQLKALHAASATSCSQWRSWSPPKRCAATPNARRSPCHDSQPRTLTRCTGRCLSASQPAGQGWCAEAQPACPLTRRGRGCALRCARAPCWGPAVGGSQGSTGYQGERGKGDKGHMGEPAAWCLRTAAAYRQGHMECRCQGSDSGALSQPWVN